jgi:hypothetical protein
MSKAGNQRIGECVYCGAIGPITGDHIPPQNLFARPRPNNLIVVPSCLSCNQSASLDDEYFRMTLSLREDMQPHPANDQLRRAVHRAFANPRKAKFTRAFFQGVRRADVETPSGIYLGQQPIYEVNLRRLERVAARIAKGLFYHTRKLRLPDDYDMISFSEEGNEYASDEFAERIRTRVLAPLWSVRENLIGPDVFSYRFLFAEDDPNVSAWLLIFFKAVRFVCVSVTQDVATVRNAK